MNPPDNEWSLIIFNILGDLSVGAFIALGLAHFLMSANREPASGRSAQHARPAGPRPDPRAGDAGCFWSCGQSGERAFNMLRNLDTSWLAREVAAYGAFLVVGGAFGVLQAACLLPERIQNRIPQGLRNIMPTVRILLAWVAAILGIIFVFCAAMIYYDPRLASRQTAWANPIPSFCSSSTPVCSASWRWESALSAITHG